MLTSTVCSRKPFQENGRSETSAPSHGSGATGHPRHPRPFVVGFRAEQAKAYNAKIKRTFASLRSNDIPIAVRMRDDLAAGLRSCRHLGGSGRHLVFFRIDGDFVEVVRLLHEVMDFNRYIDEANLD